jgi:hypothetical protein
MNVAIVYECNLNRINIVHTCFVKISEKRQVWKLYGVSIITDYNYNC